MSDFMVGDRVKFIGDNYDSHFEGALGTVLSNGSFLIEVVMDDESLHDRASTVYIDQRCAALQKKDLVVVEKALYIINELVLE